MGTDLDPASLLQLDDLEGHAVTGLDDDEPAEDEEQDSDAARWAAHEDRLDLIRERARALGLGGPARRG